MRIDETLRVLTAAVALGCGCAQAQAKVSSFCDQVRALTLDPAVAAAHWGVSVTALDGTVLCAVNEAQLFRPASTNKLFTFAAALALMGPERQFTTTVVADGEVTDGTLKGNLRLVGGGDANFGAADVPYVEPAQRPKGPAVEPETIGDIEALADQIYARGVRTITGDVIGDDTWFAWEPYPLGWEVEDLTPAFGAPVSALTVHDSDLAIVIAPDAVKAGNEASVSSLPSVSYYLFVNNADTSPRMDNPRPHLQIHRPVGSQRIDFGGDIPLNNAPVTVHAAIQDPAEFAALALKEALERRGVQMKGSARAKHDDFYYPGLSQHPYSDAGLDLLLRRMGQDAGSPGVQTQCMAQQPAWPAGVPRPVPMELAAHRSPSLGADMKYTLKESQNLHAEVALRNLGTAVSCEHTVAAGLAALRAFARSIGVANGDLVEYDGSGLSGHDLVAPRALTQLLVYAAKRTWFANFKDALPVGGVDGTLANRFAAPESKLAGRVFAKTGTLGESRTLAGYVTAASGKTIVFSVMVDNHPPGTAADRVAMDKMVEAIAAGN